MLAFVRIFVLSLFIVVVLSVENCEFKKDLCQLSCAMIGTLNLELLRKDLRKRFGTSNYSWMFTCETLSQYHWSIDLDENQTIIAEPQGEAPKIVLKCNSEFLFEFGFNVITIESTSLCANDSFDDDFLNVTEFHMHKIELYQAVENLALVGSTLYSLNNVLSVYENYGEERMSIYSLPKFNSSDHFTSIAADWDKIIIGAQNSVYAFMHSESKWSSVAMYLEPNKLGCRVAVSGSTLIVGRPELNHVLFYDLVGPFWSLTQTLIGPEESLFGYDVAIDGNFALVSEASFFSHIRCYKRDGVEWRIFHTFSSAEPSKLNLHFVALSGDIAAVAGDEEVWLYKLSDHSLMATISGDVKDVILFGDTVIVLNKFNVITVRSVSMTISAAIQPETK